MTDGPDLRAGLIRTTTAARVTRDNEFKKDMAVVAVVLILAILTVYPTHHDATPTSYPMTITHRHHPPYSQMKEERL